MPRQSPFARWWPSSDGTHDASMSDPGQRRFAIAVLAIVTIFTVLAVAAIALSR